MLEQGQNCLSLAPYIQSTSLGDGALSSSTDLLPCCRPAGGEPASAPGCPRVALIAQSVAALALLHVHVCVGPLAAIQAGEGHRAVAGAGLAATCAGVFHQGIQLRVPEVQERKVKGEVSGCFVYKSDTTLTCTCMGKRSYTHHLAKKKQKKKHCFKCPALAIYQSLIPTH